MTYEILKTTKAGDELIAVAMNIEDAHTIAQAFRRKTPNDNFEVSEAMSRQPMTKIINPKCDQWSFIFSLFYDKPVPINDNVEVGL